MALAQEGETRIVITTAIADAPAAAVESEQGQQDDVELGGLEQVVFRAHRLGNAITVRFEVGAGFPRHEGQLARPGDARQAVLLVAAGEVRDDDVQRQLAVDRPVAGDPLIDEEIGQLLQRSGDAIGRGDALAGMQGLAPRAQFGTQGLARIVERHAANTRRKGVASSAMPMRI